MEGYVDWVSAAASLLAVVAAIGIAAAGARQTRRLLTEADTVRNLNAILGILGALKLLADWQSQLESLDQKGRVNWAGTLKHVRVARAAIGTVLLKEIADPELFHIALGVQELTLFLQNDLEYKEASSVNMSLRTYRVTRMAAFPVTAQLVEAVHMRRVALGLTIPETLPRPRYPTADEMAVKFTELGIPEALIRSMPDASSDGEDAPPSAPGAA